MLLVSRRAGRPGASPLFFIFVGCFSGRFGSWILPLLRLFYVRLFNGMDSKNSIDKSSRNKATKTNGYFFEIFMCAQRLD